MADPLPITDRITIPATDLTVTTTRSGGPGGQHVNTTDTSVILRFALARCEALRPDVKARLAAAHRRWLTTDGDLVLRGDATRSRLTNLEIVRERLADAIREALVPPTERRATRPTRASSQRRLQAKKGRSALKRTRGNVSDE